MLVDEKTIATMCNAFAAHGGSFADAMRAAVECIHVACPTREALADELQRVYYSVDVNTDHDWRLVADRAIALCAGKLPAEVFALVEWFAKQRLVNGQMASQLLERALKSLPPPVSAPEARPVPGAVLKAAEGALFIWDDVLCSFGDELQAAVGSSQLAEWRNAQNALRDAVGDILRADQLAEGPRFQVTPAPSWDIDYRRLLQQRQSEWEAQARADVQQIKGLEKRAQRAEDERGRARCERDEALSKALVCCRDRMRVTTERLEARDRHIEDLDASYASERDRRVAAERERDDARRNLVGAMEALGNVERQRDEAADKVAARPEPVVIDEALAERVLAGLEQGVVPPGCLSRGYVQVAVKVLREAFGADRASVAVADGPRPGETSADAVSRIVDGPRLRAECDQLRAELADCQARLEGTLALADERWVDKVRVEHELLEWRREAEQLKAELGVKHSKIVEVADSKRAAIAQGVLLSERHAALLAACKWDFEGRGEWGYTLTEAIEHVEGLGYTCLTDYLKRIRAALDDAAPPAEPVAGPDDVPIVDWLEKRAEGGLRERVQRLERALHELASAYCDETDTRGLALLFSDMSRALDAQKEST